MSNESRKNEAQGNGTATVEWRGHDFTVSTEYDEYPVEFIEALEDGKAVGIVRGALGPKQWRVVQAQHLTMRELGDLSDRIAAAMGFGSVGESGASAD